MESRSPDRHEGAPATPAMYIDNEVTVTTPLTGGDRAHADPEGDLSEVDITSQHNSVISQTPDSTISGRMPTVICETPGRHLTAPHAPAAQ